MKKRKGKGLVYLIHFAAPVGLPLTKPTYTAHARHYIGWTLDVAKRVEQHNAGNGAKILKRAKELGIAFEVVRTWAGDRNRERQLKRQKNAPRYCPICQHQIQVALKEITILRTRY